jgi:hypothetical protein
LGKKVIRNILLLVFSIISFVCPSKSIASWDCFIKLHKQAISYAISTAPSDIKKSLIAYEDAMLKEVENIQNTPNPDLISFRSYYKDILEIAKEATHQSAACIKKSIIPYSGRIYPFTF